MYGISEATLEVGAVSVAGYADAVAPAQAIIDGAQNADAVTIEATYTLADTLANLAAADAAVRDGAASYSLTDAGADLGRLTSAQASVASGASNASAFTYTLIQAGSTFALTASAEDDLQGTSNDDLFIARSGNIDATDEVDGGAGFDTMQIELVSPVTNTIDISNVESIVINVATTVDGAAAAGAFIDAANINDSSITFVRAFSGMTDEVFVDNAGENIIVAGSGISTLNVDGNDEALIDTGNASSLVLGVSAATNEVHLKASANVVVTDSAAGTAATPDTIVVTSDTGAGINIANMVALLGAGTLEDITINGNAILAVDADMLAAGFEANGTGTLAIVADTNSTGVDMTDVNVQLNIGAAAGNVTTSVTNAENKTISLSGSTANTVDIETSGDEDFESATVVLAGNDMELTVNATNIDALNLIVNTARVGATVIDGDVTMDTGSLDVVFADSSGAAAAVTATDAGAQLIAIGSGNLSIPDLDVETFDGTAFTGAITLTIDADANTATSDIRTGSGADFVTVGATGGDVNVYTDNGNDRIDLTAALGATLVVGGDGNDTIVMGSSGAVWAGTDTILVGGAGTDTLAINLTAGDADFSAVTTSEIEIVTINAEAGVGDELTIDHGFFNGQTVTVKGDSATVSDVAFVSGASGRAIDLSKITYEASVNAITVDLSVVDISTTSPKNVTAVLSSRGETVTGYTFDSSYQFDLNLGGGNDTITLSDNGGGDGVGGFLTLGAGDDTVVVVDGSSTSSGALSDVVKIKDWSDDDTFDVSGLTSATVVVGPNTSGVAVDVDAADAQGVATDIKANVTSGIVTLEGADAGVIDTLAEWLDVVDLLDEGWYGVVFGGNTYVIENEGDAGTDIGIVIELTGITNKTLGASGTNVIALDFV